MTMRLLIAQPRYDGDYAPRSEKRTAQLARHQSARTVASTPVFREFLARHDVQVIQFPSGWMHLYVGNTSYVGETLLAAVEAAFRAGPMPQTPEVSPPQS